MNNLSHSFTIPSVKRSSSHRMRSILFSGFTVLLIFGPLAFGAVENWAIMGLEMGATLLISLWLVEWFAGPIVVAGSSPVYRPMALLGVLVAIQLVFNTTAYREATLVYALQMVTYFFVFWIGLQLFQDRVLVKNFATVMSIFGFVLALGAIVQSFASPLKIYGFRLPRYGGGIYGPYVNHNHYAGLMEMLMPFPLLAVIRRSLRIEKRVIWGFVTLVMISSIFLSGSRGGMISCTLELALIMGVFFGRNRDRRIATVIAANLVLLVGFVFWLGSEQVSHRVESIAQPGISGQERLLIAKDCWKMFADRPLLGWGLGTFTIIYPHYRSFYTDDVVNAAHNDYLQFLVEMGLLGFALILWFLGFVLKSGTGHLAAWANFSSSGVRVAGVLGITGILVHSLSDFNLQVPANAAMFFGLCALVASEPSK